MNFDAYSKSFLHFHTTELPELVVNALANEQLSLIDLGAGDGVLLVSLKLNGYLKNATNVVAVDLSEDRCTRLRQYTDFDVICSDVTHLPTVTNHSFNTVICTQVIEHVDQDKLLAEIKRIMHVDGKLYIASVVKKWYGWWYYRTAAGKWALDPTHLREYSSKEEYENVIKKAGFQVITTKLSPLKLSIIEFIIRRFISHLYKIESINAFFIRNKWADFLRRYLYIRVPGYYIIETIATHE